MSDLRQRAHPDQVAAIRESVPADVAETTIRRFERLPQMRFITPDLLGWWLTHPNHESQERMLKTLACLGKLWAFSIYPQVARLLGEKPPYFLPSVEDMDARAFMIEPPEVFGELARKRINSGIQMESYILARDGEAEVEDKYIQMVRTTYPSYGVQGVPDIVWRDPNGQWCIADAKLATGKTKPPGKAPRHYACQVHCYRQLLLEALGVPEAEWPHQNVRMMLYRRHLDEWAREELGLAAIAGMPGAPVMSEAERWDLIDNHTTAHTVEVPHDQDVSDAILEAGRASLSRLRNGTPLGLRALREYKPVATAEKNLFGPEAVTVDAPHDDYLRQCLFGSP